MSVRIVITPHFSELYGVRESALPAPLSGESVREYIVRAGLGKEEDILPVVGGRAKSFDYRFEENDEVTIYPMAASG
ncbi:hypothetical protein LJC40_01825 [Synergistaceae bacterium OttesenSCG-928-D05]|nr:hypothetical protein [Synergistaceae bacterium OttesenSCG-928-D05]